MKYLIFAVLLLTGCSQEVKYIDSNTGKEVPPPKPVFETINLPVACDNRGYAYYKSPGYGVFDATYTPIFDNGIGNIQQILCKDL